MKSLFKLAVLVSAIFATPVLAQVVVLPVVNTASGLKTNSTGAVIIGSDGVEKGTTGSPLVTSCPTCSGGSGPSSSQLPATLGAKTGALSLSVVPNTDTAFPVSGTFWQVTQPVSAASLPLPAGAATSSNQATLITNLGSPYQAGGTLPLPSGAATSALQTTMNTTLGSPFQAGGSIGNTSFAATQATASNLNAQVVGNVASAAADSGNGIKISGVYISSGYSAQTSGTRGDLKIDQYYNLRAAPVLTAITDADGQANTSAGVAAGAAFGGSGQNLFQAFYPHVFNGTNWDRQRGDTNGTVNQPYALTGSRWQYAAASGGISNTTTAVTVCPAQGGALRCYMTSLQLDATALGAATEIVVRDGAAGTVIWRGVISTAGVSNDNVVFPVPLKGTANTLMEVATITATITGAVYVNTQGFAGN